MLRTTERQPPGEDLALGAKGKDALLSSISSPAGAHISQTQERVRGQSVSRSRRSASTASRRWGVRMRGQMKESRHMDLSASLLFITLYLYVLFSFPYGIVVYQINKLIKRHRKEGGEGRIKGAKEKRKDILYPPHVAWHSSQSQTLKLLLRILSSMNH